MGSEDLRAQLIVAGLTERETMNQFSLTGFGFRFSQSETTIPNPIHRFAPAGSNRWHHHEPV